MKPIVIVLIIISITSINGISQNRIKDWNIEKITSVQVEVKTSRESDKQIFNNETEINRIVAFLKSVEFKEIDNENIISQIKKNSWSYRISFKDQKDQVYLFDNLAFIGRSSFKIDPTVNNDFGKLLEKLQQKKINSKHK